MTNSMINSNMNHMPFPRHLILKNGKLKIKEIKQNNQQKLPNYQNITYLHTIRYLYDSDYYNQLKQYQQRALKAQKLYKQLCAQFQGTKSILTLQIIHQQEQLNNRNTQILYLRKLLENKKYQSSFQQFNKNNKQSTGSNSSKYEFSLCQSLLKTFEKSDKILNEIQLLSKYPYKFPNQKKITLSSIHTNDTTNSCIFEEKQKKDRGMLSSRRSKNTAIISQFSPVCMQRLNNLQKLQSNSNLQRKFIQRNKLKGQRNQLKISICQEQQLFKAIEL